MTRLWLPAVLAITLTAGPSLADSTPLRVVPQVDYGRYGGTWYEIARLPNRFQKICAGDVTATYTGRADGLIDVVNRCREADGSFREAAGVARPVKGQPSSVLKVRFAPAFLSFLPMVWGDYQIIELGPDYDYAVVGSPNRSYLWVLSRKPTLDPEVYQRLVAGAETQGFGVSALVRTGHSSDSP